MRQVVLPPTRTIALVEFASSSEARASFKALAYRNFKGRPLLLEKAPALVFNGRTPESASDSISMKISSPPGSITTSSKTLTPTTRDVLKEPTTTTVNDADDAAADQTVTTIYVKNLNFSTTAESFTSLFASVPGFRSAKISTKRDPKNPKGMLSMGFGFVEFDTPQNARFAMKTLQVRGMCVVLC